MSVILLRDTARGGCQCTCHFILSFFFVVLVNNSYFVVLKVDF